MGRRVIALCTGDARYLAAFADYCARNEGERMSVKTFDTKEKLDAYEKDTDIDLILLDAAFAGNGRLSYKSRIAVLSDEKYVDAKDYIYVYKFQSMDAIIRQIYQIFAETPEAVMYKCTAERRSDITGVFSPCYPEQREQYARELAAMYSLERKVLYINLAELTEYDCDEEEGVSELMYFLDENNKPASYRLLTMLRDTDGYKSVAGVKHYRDLYDMSPDCIDKLFKCVETLDEFEKVVVDIGFMGNFVYDILGRCNKIYMPVGNEKSMRIKHLWHDMALCGRDNLINDIKVIQLPSWWSERKDMRSKWVCYEK